MPVTDPVADMLTRIRNAVNVRADTVEIPSSGEIKGAISSVGRGIMMYHETAHLANQAQTPGLLDTYLEEHKDDP